MIVAVSIIVNAVGLGAIAYCGRSLPLKQFLLLILSAVFLSSAAFTAGLIFGRLK